jgi:hypothetical protein
MEVIVMSQCYQCVFCGETVMSSHLDVCALILVTNRDKPSEAQQEQEFWCHAACFRQRTHPSVPLYIFDLQDMDRAEKIR